MDLEKYQYLALPQADHWGVLMPAGDPLAQKETVSPRDLAGRPVMVSYRPSVEQQLATLLGEDFQRMEILSTHNLIRNTALLVEQGLGYAITLQGAVEIYDDRRVCFRPSARSCPAGRCWPGRSTRSSPRRQRGCWPTRKCF